MSQVRTEPAPPGVHRPTAALRIVLVAVLVASVAALSLQLVDGPRFVDRVTVVNEASTTLDVDMSESRSGGWTPAGVALERGTTPFEHVIDHGDVWYFRLTSGDRSVVVKVPRDELARNGWRLTVPASVTDTLASAGRPVD